MRRPNIAKLVAECDNFNRRNPVGTPVAVQKDNGSIVETKTRSQAYVMSEHTPVVFVDGISGCYALSRVSPL